MTDENEAASQAVTEADWVEQFRDHVKQNYPQVYLWVYKSHAGSEYEHVVINSIKVEQDARGRGLARAVLTELCALADQHGDTLSVTPNPTRTPEWDAYPAKWARFFRGSLGFVTNRGSRGRDFTINETMYRRPRPVTPQSEA